MTTHLKKADLYMTKYYKLSIHQRNTHIFKTLIQASHNSNLTWLKNKQSKGFGNSISKRFKGMFIST